MSDLRQAADELDRESDRRDAANKHCYPRQLGHAEGLRMAALIVRAIAWAESDPATRSRIPPDDPRDDQVRQR